MSSIFSFDFPLKDFLSNPKNVLRLLNITTVKIFDTERRFRRNSICIHFLLSPIFSRNVLVQDCSKRGLMILSLIFTKQRIITFLDFSRSYFWKWKQKIITGQVVNSRKRIRYELIKVFIHNDKIIRSLFEQSCTKTLRLKIGDGSKCMQIEFLGNLRSVSKILKEAG